MVSATMNGWRLASVQAWLNHTSAVRSMERASYSHLVRGIQFIYSIREFTTYPERPIFRITPNPLNYQIPGFIPPRINHRNSALINSVVILPLEIPRPRVPMLMESLWITLEWLTIEMIACSNTTRLHGLARIRIYCRIGMNWDSWSWLSSTEIFFS